MTFRGKRRSEVRRKNKNELPETQVWWEKRRTPLVATVLLRFRAILLLIFLKCYHSYYHSLRFRF
jgi:hypothetical protein